MTAPRALIAALALSALLPILAPRPFFSPDEAFYAQVAREMAETGDFVVPRFDGHPWLEKPPLVAWLLAGAFALVGWGFPAAALLNTAATLAVVAIVGARARRVDGERAALFAAGAYLTMLGPPAAAGTALTDPVLTLCTTAAIAAFLADRSVATILCGLFLGLGVLAKGPVAPLVVLPAIVVSAAGSPGHGVRRALGAVGVAALVAAPWHVLLAMRGLWPEYESVFLGQHVLQRALVAERQGGPFWYYLPVLWLVAFPWGTQIVLAAARWRRWLGSPEAASVAVTLVGFSLSATKLPHYLLPVLPWVALALGRSAAAQWSGVTVPGARVLTRVGGIAAGIAIGLLAFWGPAPPLAGLVPEAVRPLLAAAALACPILGFLESTRRLRAAWLGWASLALLLRVVLLFVSLPNANRILVEEPVAHMVREAAGPDRPLLAHRYFRPYLVAYGVRGWRVTTSQAELVAALAARERTLALTSDSYEGELRAAGARGYATREVGRVRGLGLLGGPVMEIALFRIEAGRDQGAWFTDAETLGPRDGGFGALEANPLAASYRWTLDAVAHLEIRAPALYGSATLRVRGWGYPFESPSQTLVVRFNGHEVGRTALARRPATWSFAVPDSAFRAGPQQLELEVAPLFAPARLTSFSKDRRPLGLALDWASLDPASPRLDLMR